MEDFTTGSLLFAVRCSTKITYKKIKRLASDQWPIVGSMRESIGPKLSVAGGIWGLRTRRFFNKNNAL